MSKYVDFEYFETETCCNCGMQFAMTQDFQRRRRKDRKLFYCPAGHSQYYSGKSEEQKLKDQIKEKQKQLEAESGRATLIAYQRDELSKSYNKIRNRVKNGVCPCCTRTFQNLLNHMKTEHPEFGSHKTFKSLRDAYGLTQTAIAEEIGITAAYISLYENEKPVPEYAKNEIESWVESNA